MSKAWTDKKEYQLLSGELATSVGREFERVALPLIRIIWADTIAPPPLGTYDRIGVDHMVWADEGQATLVVQYKGFAVPEEELGNSQINDCIASIKTFRDSERRAATYLLVHNRTGRNSELRYRVESALRELVESKQVDRAELWDRQKFLREAFNKILYRVRSLIALNATSAKEYADTPQDYALLKEVPFQVSDLLISPNQLKNVSEPVQHLANPCNELMSFNNRNLILMIGGAGFGKTTAALRTFESNNQVFYVPGASISAPATSTKAFLRECVNVDSIFSDFEEADVPTVSRILNPVIEQVLKEKDNAVVLVIDGLDESVYFSYRGGLQWLFNHLRDVLVPVVLLARAEFWYARLADFGASIGEISKSESEGRRVKLIELSPWSKQEIGTLARRYRERLDDPASKEHIDTFIRMVSDDSYHQVYGDIPSRPLFLRFILDTVAENGVQRTGKAQLYYDWAQMKISRDVTNPMRWGPIGRAPIVGITDSLQTTIRLAFKAMMLAALRMTMVNGNSLELLPTCKLDDVLLSDPLLKGITDPTGLFLNSLLVPVSPALLHREPEIRFAHRAYQEFFLALYISEFPTAFEEVILPDSIREHLADLAKEKIRVSH